MSDHFLVVIPGDPNAELPDTANALRDALALLAGTGEARVKDYGKLQFIDCGENIESFLPRLHIIAGARLVAGADGR
jgi:hypothetical protein